MIDIHSHILPGIDDGARNLEDALEMARIAVSGGTTTMFTTPHVSNMKELTHTRLLTEKIAALQQEIDRRQIALTLIQGAEVYPIDGILQFLEEGYPLTLGVNGKFILLDMPLMALPNCLDSLVFSLQAHGYHVIMAHPERVGPIQQTPQVLEEMVQHGLLLQITASSLLGRNGKEADNCAFKLLQQQWVHFIASDCHTSTARRPGLSRAAQEIIDEFGTELAEKLFEQNGNRIINGETVPTNPLPYVPEKKKSFFSCFKRK